MAKLFCSFCGKPQHDVIVLIAGPSCHICNECVDDCVRIIVERSDEIARRTKSIKLIVCN